MRERGGTQHAFISIAKLHFKSISILFNLQMSLQVSQSVQPVLIDLD